MKKQITFNDNDEMLVNLIAQYQKENEIPYFVEAVRQLCKRGLAQSINLKIDFDKQILPENH